MVKLTGFSKASPAERIEKLAQAGPLSEEGLQTVRDNDTLPLSLANEMVENVLGTLALPFCSSSWLPGRWSGNPSPNGDGKNPLSSPPPPLD